MKEVQGVIMSDGRKRWPSFGVDSRPRDTSRNRPVRACYERGPALGLRIANTMAAVMNTKLNAARIVAIILAAVEAGCAVLVQYAPTRQTAKAISKMPCSFLDRTANDLLSRKRARSQL